MAQKVVIVDDVTGEDGALTRTFGLDAQAYTIDLTEANHARLREALAPFIARAERLRGGGPVPQVTRHTAQVRTFDPVQVRGWARAHGLEVPERGRIPGALVEQWRAWQESQTTAARAQAAAAQEAPTEAAQEAPRRNGKASKAAPVAATA